MSNDGLSFPSVIQLQFRRAKALCKRDAIGQLYQSDEESYEPVRPTFAPYKAGTNSANPVHQQVLCASGGGDEDDQETPLSFPQLGKQNSFAQVALSVEQMLVQRRAGGLKPDKSRPFHIGIRLSQNERELVVQHAEKSGLTISEYVRASVLGAGYASSIDPVKRQQLIDANRELSRQGNNLNQIAKHLNAGITSPEQGGVHARYTRPWASCRLHVRPQSLGRRPGRSNMIIKSHIRGGYRAAADYLKDQGLNEKTRIVEISDPEAKNLDDAFHNMWVVAGCTKATKPLHHISINPMKDERLTDKQVLAIVERCEQKYGYKQFHHQRVIIEHVKDGRQHFHVVWNRVSLMTGRAVWPGQHWNKSKQVCREMEKELGLKRPMPRRAKRALKRLPNRSRVRGTSGRYQTLKAPIKPISRRPLTGGKQRMSPSRPRRRYAVPAPYLPSRPFRPTAHYGRRRKHQNIPDSEKMHFRRPEMSIGELIAWAFETGNYAVLASFGIYIHPENFEP